MKEIAIIGGGAAGFLCAIELKKAIRNCNVTIFESGSKPLAKLSITGGGRCNITNTFKQVDNLKSVYPRGSQLLKRAFTTFSPSQTFDYFQNLGIKLVVLPDQTIFPQSQSAMEVVDTLLDNAQKLGVKIKVRTKVTKVANNSNTKESSDFIHNKPYILEINGKKVESFDYVVITSGGAPNPKMLSFLNELDLTIIPPTPSLFAFELAENKLKELQGIVIENVTLSISATKFKAEGTLLITHFGISGPATLKLSSYASRYLSENHYNAPIRIMWMKQSDIESFVDFSITNYPDKLIKNTHPKELASRLWEYLISKTDLRENLSWRDIKQKGVNKIVEVIVNDEYTICSKCDYKEEFVTCGGVSTANIDLNTLESKRYKGLYFAGEVLDIDGITGGFNLQAAWSTGFTVSQSIKKELLKS